MYISNIRTAPAMVANTKYVADVKRCGLAPNEELRIEKGLWIFS